MITVREPKPGSIESVDRSRRVLAVVGDTQVGLWVVRDLGRKGLKVLTVCHTDQGLSAHSRYSGGAWMLEPGRDFVDQVEELARQWDVGSILPIAESYHRALIGVRERFEPDIHIFSPQADAFRQATDKDHMHALARKLGVPVAEGTTLEKFMAEGGGHSLKFPLVLRTRNQNAGDEIAPWKAEYARDEEDLARIHGQVAHIASNVLVQEYHPGAEDHVQVLIHRGEPVMAGEYIGEHHYPLAGGVTVQRITCRHENVIDDAVRLLQAIGWEGLAGVQVHYDPKTGRYIFLEINPRFIGGTPTLIMAGFETAYLLWQSHFEPEKMRPGRYRLGLRTRIVGGDANWLLGTLRRDALPPDQHHLSRPVALAKFLWNCGPWTRDDVFSFRDPKPAWVDLKQMLKHLRGRSVDLIGDPQAGGAQT